MRVLDRAGRVIDGAPVSLVVLDTAALALDTALPGVIGRAPATAARLVAVSGSLRSEPLSIRVLPAADSLEAAGPSGLTVGDADSESAPLLARLLDVTTTPGTAAALGGRPVSYRLVEPAFADLASATAVLGNDSLSAAVTTALSGGATASVVVKRRGPAQPDSVVVEASAERGSGTLVPGSPLRFVVRFQ